MRNGVRVDPAGCGGDAGTETILYTFQGGADGAYPISLIYANGSLYGTNQLLNDNGGTVFELFLHRAPCGAATWNQSTIFTFTGGPEGGYPTSVQAGPNGTIYGTTDSGGNLSCTGGCGVVFQLTLASRPGARRASQ